METDKIDDLIVVLKDIEYQLGNIGKALGDLGHGRGNNNDIIDEHPEDFPQGLAVLTRLAKAVEKLSNDTGTKEGSH